jgi:hypothetical protein
MGPWPVRVTVSIDVFARVGDPCYGFGESKPKTNAVFVLDKMDKTLGPFVCLSD